jgi:hypothetical protein
LQKNNYLIFSLFLLLGFTPFTKAERTSGFCSLTEEEKGKEVLALYPQVNFYCKEVSPLRNKIWIDAWVKTNDLYDGIKLKEKSKVYNENLQVIGKVSMAFNPMKIMETKDTMIHLVLAGYLEKSCSDPTFICEKELSILLNKATNNEKKSFFEAYLKKYQLFETKENAEYTSYLLVQPDFIKQLLEPRLLMVFYKNELIAIFHTNELMVKKYDSIEMGSEYKMIYNSKFSEHTKMEMVEIYKRKLE